MILLSFLIGAQKARAAFSPAPEDVVGPAKLECCIDGALDLRAGSGDDIQIGTCGRHVHAALVAEQFGCAPHAFDQRN